MFIARRRWPLRVDNKPAMYANTFTFEAERASLFDTGDATPLEAVRRCIMKALRYDGNDPAAAKAERTTGKARRA
jgi:hypothetical protein